MITSIYKKIIISVSLCIAVAVHNVSAAPAYQLLQAAPAINDYQPEKFHPGNNLLKKNNGISFTDTGLIAITCKLVDQNNLPITGAKVQIWQTDKDNRYVYKLLKTKFAESDADFTTKKPTKISSFKGNGSSSSDNMGVFKFFTCMPGKDKNDFAVINLRILHPDFQTFQTQINITDNKKASDLSKNQHSSDSLNTALYINEQKQAFFALQIPIKLKHKQY